MLHLLCPMPASSASHNKGWALQAMELEGLLGEAEKLVNALQSENADLKGQLTAIQSRSPALDTTPPTAPSASKAGESTATDSQSAAPPAQDPALSVVSELGKSEAAIGGEGAPAVAAAVVPVAQRSPDHLLALAGCLQRPAVARRCTSDAGLVPGGLTAQPGKVAGAVRRRSESGAPRSAARLPLAARTCLLRAQDALLASSPAQRNGTAGLASAAAVTLPDGGARDAHSPAAQLELAASAVMPEDPLLPPLPFEGLSQRLSQVQSLQNLLIEGANCALAKPLLFIVGTCMSLIHVGLLSMLLLLAGHMRVDGRPSHEDRLPGHLAAQGH